MRWSKVFEKFLMGFLGVALTAATGAGLDFVGANGVNLVAEMGLAGTFWGAIILGLFASANNYRKHRKDPAPEAV